MKVIKQINLFETLELYHSIDNISCFTVLLKEQEIINLIIQSKQSKNENISYFKNKLECLEQQIQVNKNI